MSGGREPRHLDPAELPAVARLVLRAEKGLRNAEFPRALAREDDPNTPSRGALLLIMVVVGVATYLVLFLSPPWSGVRIAAGPVAAAMWAGATIGLEPGVLARRRLGPWLPAAMSWLGAVVVLEVILEGWSQPRGGTTALQTLLVAATGMVAWGKARLDAEM